MPGRSSTLNHWSLPKTNASPAASELMNRVDLNVPANMPLSNVPNNGSYYPTRCLIVTGEPKTWNSCPDQRGRWMLLLSGSRSVQLLLNWSVDDCPGLSYFRQLGPTAPKWSPRGPSNEDKTKDQLLGEIKRLSAARGMCNVQCAMCNV